MCSDVVHILNIDLVNDIQRMGKNKKTKKNTNKLLANSHSSKSLTTGLKTNSVYNTKTSKHLLISGVSKTSPANNPTRDSSLEPILNDERLENDCLDHSLTREPINLGVRNVRQILTCIKDSTLEVKDLILNECNIIYECKICTNLFRSLANFLAHKRIYCKNHFCERMLLFDSTHIHFNDEEEDNCDDNDLEDNFNEEQPNESNDEQTVQSLKPNIKSEPEIVFPVSCSVTNDSAKDFKPNTEKPIVSEKRKFIDNCIKKVEDEQQKRESTDQSELQLTTINSNPNAMFQSINKIETNDELNENKNIFDKKQIIADLFKAAKKSRQTNDSQTVKRQRVEDILPPIDEQTDVNSNESNENTINEPQKCDICDSVFTSNKTLRVHMRTIHSATRIVFPCPLCSLEFKQLSNATRHLIQVHKKTKTQANTLKEIMKRRSYLTNSENSSEVEDISDEDIEESVQTIDRKNCINNTKSRSVETDFSKPTEIKTTERNVPRISSACVYKCGSVFDWAPAKKSHEKSCRKRLEINTNEKSEISVPYNEINGSTHPTVVSKDKRVSSQSQQTSIVPNSNPNPNSTPNHMPTNLILPNGVEEKIKEFADLKSLRCKHCPQQDFMNLNQLLQHSVTHIGYSIYKCHGCSYQSIHENDMKYHLMNNHNINEDMISKHYQTLPNLTQTRLLILPMKSNKINSPNGSVQTDSNSDKNSKFESKLKIHLRTMGNTSKKCYEIVDK